MFPATSLTRDLTCAMGLARDETQAERVNASKTTSWHVLVFILNMIPGSHLCDRSRGPEFVPRLSPHTLWEGTVQWGPASLGTGQAQSTGPHQLLAPACQAASLSSVRGHSRAGRLRGTPGRERAAEGGGVCPATAQARPAQGTASPKGQDLLGQTCHRSGVH